MAEVLIIEKDPTSREMLAWYLTTQGHSVAEAGSAEEALAALATSAPDVVVLDLVLPDRSGHQLLADMRAQGLAGEASVVVLAESRDLSWMVRSWELGASAHLTRPVAPELVGDAVARHHPARQVALSS